MRPKLMVPGPVELEAEVLEDTTNKTPIKEKKGLFGRLRRDKDSTKVRP